MKKILHLSLLLVIFGQFQANAQLKRSIENQVIDLGSEFEQIPEDRKRLLDQIAFKMFSKSNEGNNLQLIFIDDGKSGFSELAKIWLKTGLTMHDLEQDFKITAAGTTGQVKLDIQELEEVGFKVKDETTESGYYKVKYGSGSWEINKIELDSLMFANNNVLQIILSSSVSVEDKNDKILFPFYSHNDIDREMIYLSARIHNLKQRK